MPSQPTFNTESHQPAMTFKRAPDGTLNWTASQPISKGQSRASSWAACTLRPYPARRSSTMLASPSNSATTARSIARSTGGQYHTRLSAVGRLYRSPAGSAAKNYVHRDRSGASQRDRGSVQENGNKQGRSRADTKGSWSYAYVSSRVGITDTVLAARACVGTTCSPYAMVSLERSRSFWCAHSDPNGKAAFLAAKPITIPSKTRQAAIPHPCGKARHLGDEPLYGDDQLLSLP